MQFERAKGEEDLQALKRDLDSRFRGPLMSFFLRRLGNRAECEDLTQEVFARLISATTVERVENVEAFVFKVAANLLHDRQRSARRWRMHEGPATDREIIDELTNYFVEDREPERVFLAKEALTSVLDSLKDLGERTSGMFILFRLEKMKQREIAAIYGVSPSTVEKHIAKAIMHLTLHREKK